MNLEGLTEIEVIEKTRLTLEELRETKRWLATEEAQDLIRYLKRGLGSYPSGYNTEAAIMDGMGRRGETGRDMRSVRIGFSIGYQEGFRLAAKYACDAFEILNNGEINASTKTA